MTKFSVNQIKYNFEMPGESVTVTAEFNDPITVTYDLDGGNIDGDDSDVEIKYAKFDTYGDDFPADPEKEDYRFLGWHDTDDTDDEDSIAEIDADTEVETEKTYVAKWIRQYKVTVPAASTAGTTVVTPADGEALTAGSTTVLDAGTVLTIVATPTGEDSTFYAIMANGEKFTSVESNPATKQYSVSEGVATGKLTVTEDVDILGLFMTLVEYYDFEDDGNGTAASFTTKNRAGGSTVTADPADDSNKVFELVADNNAANQSGFTRLPFTSAAAANTIALKVEFDSYAVSGSARPNFLIYDNALRADVIPSRSYSATGVAYQQGITDSSNKYRVFANNDYEITPYAGKWLTSEILFDYETGKLNFSVAEKGSDTALKSGTNIDFPNSTTHADGFEIFTITNNDTLYADNIKVYAVEFPAQEITINYVDEEGTTVKTATASGTKGLSYTATDAQKESFELGDNPNKKRYVFDAENADNVTTIESVDANNATLTLNVETIEYQPVQFEVSYYEATAAEKAIPIAIAGTPTDTTADEVDTSVTATIPVAAEAENAKVTTDAIYLLPGTYTYSITPTADYGVVEDEITVAAAAVTEPIALTANTAAHAKVTLVYTTDGTASGDVAKEVVLYNGTSDPMFVGMSVPADKVAEANTNNTVNKKDRQLKVVNSGNLTYKVYNVDKATLPTADIALANTDTDKKIYVKATPVTVADGEDTVSDFYMYEDFEDYADGDNGNNKVQGFNIKSASAIKASGTRYGNVLWFRSGPDVWTAYNWKADATVNAATPIAAEHVKIEFDMNLGSNTNSNPKYTSFTLSDSASKPIVYFYDNMYTGKIDSVKINDNEKMVADTELASARASSPYTTDEEKCHVTIVVDYENMAASITFSRGEFSKEYVGSLAGLTAKNIATGTFTLSSNGSTSNDAADNFKVYATSETVEIPPATLTLTSTSEDDGTYTVDGGTYTVSASSEAVKNGTASVPVGETVTVTTVPDEGNTAVVSVNDGDVEVNTDGNTHTFLMPEGGATVTVAYKIKASVTVNYVYNSNTVLTETDTVSDPIYVNESENYTLPEQYSTGTIKLAADETTKKFKVYKLLGTGDSTTISQITQKNNVINLNVEPVAGDFYYYADFDNGLHDWVDKNAAAASTAKADTATENAKSGKILVSPAGGTHEVSHSPKIDIGTATDIKVTLNFRLDAPNKHGSRSVDTDLAITSAAPANAGYLQATDALLLRINGNTLTSGTHGVWDTFVVNGVDKKAEMVKAAANERYPNGSNTNTTGWMHLEATIHKNTNTIDYEIKPITNSGDTITLGAVVASATGAAFANSSATVSDGIYIYSHIGEAWYSDNSIDDITVSEAE